MQCRNGYVSLYTNEGSFGTSYGYISTRSSVKLIPKIGCYTEAVSQNTDVDIDFNDHIDGTASNSDITKIRNYLILKDTNIIIQIKIISN